MATYGYTIRDAGGAMRQGTREGETDRAVVRWLQEQGYTVLKVEQTRVAKPRSPGGGFGGVKLSDLSIFCRQFSTMVDAGVSLVRCLSVLGEQTASSKLRRIVADVEAEVQAGQPLSKALSKYPNVFSNLFIGLVRAGEVGGALEESLQRLSVFLEKDMELRRKVRGAMTYPCIVMVVALGIVIGLVTFILPRFMTLFTELGMPESDMPVMTVMLMNFSKFLTTKWWVVLLMVVAFSFSFRMFVRTRVGRRAYDRVKLKAPVFGKLNHRICLARFSRTLSTLLISGVPILQALETVAGTVANEIIGDAILEARSRIREGDRIADPLQKSKMFPPMVVQMIAIGEESGALDQMLTKVADFYESEVDASLQSLTSSIEPVMIVLMGGAVGFIVISMFLPLVAIIQSLSSGGGE
ncbi:MAG TPA: type II secretion system F family protein [Armatimonadota bacterium]|nr:type II secretion system F family protein [Armatimonadota bacterium]